MTTLKRKRSTSLSSESSESTADSSDSCSSEDTNELNDDSSSEEESDAESSPYHDIPVDFYAREDWHAVHPMPTPRSGDEWDSGQIPFKLAGDWEVWDVKPGAFKGCLVGDCSADEGEKEISVEEEEEDVVMQSIEPAERIEDERAKQDDVPSNSENGNRHDSLRLVRHIAYEPAVSVSSAVPLHALMPAPATLTTPCSGREVRAICGKRVIISDRLRVDYKVRWHDENRTWKNARELVRNERVRRMIEAFDTPGISRKKRDLEIVAARALQVDPISEAKKLTLTRIERRGEGEGEDEDVVIESIVAVVCVEDEGNDDGVVVKAKVKEDEGMAGLLKRKPASKMENTRQRTIARSKDKREAHRHILEKADLDKRARPDHQILNHRLSRWHDLYLRPPGRGYRRVESRDENIGDTKLVILCHGKDLGGLKGASRLSRIAALRKWYQEVDRFAKGSCLTTKWQYINRQPHLIHSVLDRAIGRQPGEYLNQLLEQLNAKDKRTIIYAEGDKGRVGEIMERICRKLDEESEDYVDKRAAELVIRKWMKETKIAYHGSRER